MLNLQMSLKRKWFELTKAGVKTEDYREITPYWIKRLMIVDSEDADTGMALCAIRDGYTIDEAYEIYGATLKKVNYNIMTLGYPKSGDTERILKLEHKGIEIREGNPDWGAEPGKLYFVIKHGKIIK